MSTLNPDLLQEGNGIYGSIPIYKNGIEKKKMERTKNHPLS